MSVVEASGAAQARPARKVSAHSGQPSDAAQCSGPSHVLTLRQLPPPATPSTAPRSLAPALGGAKCQPSARVGLCGGANVHSTSVPQMSRREGKGPPAGCRARGPTPAYAVQSDALGVPTRSVERRIALLSARVTTAPELAKRHALPTDLSRALGAGWAQSECAVGGKIKNQETLPGGKPIGTICWLQAPSRRPAACGSVTSARRLGWALT